MNRPLGAVIWGLTHFHTETGTEGGYWAVQDIRGIDQARPGQPGSWSYYGLLRLRDGDRLTIFEPDGLPLQGDKPYGQPNWEDSVIWQGEIRLREFPPFTEDALGYWIHAEQEGVPRDQWARWFIRELPCRLETSRPPWPIGHWVMPLQGYEGIRVRSDRLYLMSDGSAAWQPYSPPGTGGAEVPYELLKFLEKQRKDEASAYVGEDD